MATFTAIWQPKSASGGLSDSQQVVLGAAGTNVVVVGVRQKVLITVTAAVSIRFSLGANSTAVATDFVLPSAGILYYFETGDEFDRINFFSTPGATVSVMRLSA